MTKAEKREKLLEAVKISPLYKTWWSGDPRVEPLMSDVRAALVRNDIEGDAYTDIYNRAYEAIYKAIKLYDRKKLMGEL